LKDYEKENQVQVTIVEYLKTQLKQGGKKLILSVVEDRNRINDIIIVRDGRQFPMTRKEIIGLISDVAESSLTQANFNISRLC